MKKKKEPIEIKFLTVQQYADRKSVHRNQIYQLIRDKTIVLDETIIAGKGFIEWEKYSDLVIGDRSTTMKRRIINRAKDEIKAEILAELKK